MDIRDIEDRIIATLRAEVGALRTVEAYTGQLSREIEKLPVRFPAAYVVMGGAELSPVDGPVHREALTFSVLVASRSLRGGREEYGLIRDVLTALTNEDFGLDIERMRPLKTSLVFMDGAVTVYGIDFRTGFDSTYGY